MPTEAETLFHNLTRHQYYLQRTAVSMSSLATFSSSSFLYPVAAAVAVGGVDNSTISRGNAKDDNNYNTPVHAAFSSSPSSSSSSLLFHREFKPSLFTIAEFIRIARSHRNVYLAYEAMLWGLGCTSSSSNSEIKFSLSSSSSYTATATVSHYPMDLIRAALSFIYE